MDQAVPPAGIGHNNGPELDGETTWRSFAWSRARADLLPVLPIEVVRRRVKRAQELGLPYKTYAGIRASTGRDVIGFLFSSNALHILREGEPLPADRRLRLEGLVGADRTAVLQPPLTAATLLNGPVDAVFAAPPSNLGWPEMRDRIRAILLERCKPADGYLVIGQTSLEREWSEAGRTAGFLTGERYFDVRSAQV
jgi:hypothetical protein